MNSPKSHLNSPIKSPLNSPGTISSTSSLTQRLNELLCSFPQWNDPILVQSLFAPLPSRSSKPEAFAQKFNFWHDVLLSSMRQRLLAGSSAFCLQDTRGLGQKYFKNYGVGGLYPICLPGILKEMIRNGSAITSIESILEDSKQRRESWFGRLFTFLTATTSAEDAVIDDLDDDVVDLPQSLVIVPLLNEQLQLLKEHFSSSPSTLPFTLEQFKSVVNACRLKEGLAEIVSQDDLMLLLRFLVKKSFVNYSLSDNVVKLANRGPITQMDKDVVKVRGVADRLSAQISHYSQSATALRATAAQKVANGDRSGALMDLKRVGAIDSFIKDRMGALSNLDALLLKIEGAHDDVAVMEAYRSGSGLLKSLLKELDGIEEVIDEAALLMTEVQDKSLQLSSPLFNKEEEGDDGLEELETELANLVVHPNKQEIEPASQEVTEEVIETTKTVTEPEVQSEAEALEAA